ncbi:DUF192 domain-containing protein [Roseicyclus marinus]|uniref:DUF192 domain-containing protein n=1 Tax=Roseicyclus marinus TaxID=2161673 RepID=UPI00241063F6|nr:DUF192 domain-containing protein [Roseicyclus marinus]MDG3040163.1 DUF192 domain-containing protein [Roseicyclus marinus]
MRLFLVVLAAIVGLAWGGSPARAACSDDRLEMRGDFGSVRFRVVIADTPQERAQGLMNVPEMPRMSGMLFVYERPQSVSFWMENTLIPLDMIFADETGVVRRIHENAVPLDRTPIPGGEGIQYVLEINGGMAAVLGLSEGDEMRHPSIVQEAAAWPCAAE